MKQKTDTIKVISPKNQLYLYGYKKNFNNFIKLFNINKMPNSFIFSGAKGLGKSTFAYHIINYLFSKNEDKSYNLDNFSISEDNKSYKLLCENTHPNFFLIDNKISDKEIKIEQIRSLIKFLNKTTYLNNLKIVLIDNADLLNLNSSNALLKAIEEPKINTFFFIIHNSSNKLLNTVKSRCLEFKFFMNLNEKKFILKNIANQYKLDININDILEKFYFETPGNLFKYFSILSENNLSILDDKISCILYFIDKYNKDRNPNLLNFMMLFIEKHYNDLYSMHSSLDKCFLNSAEITKQIKNMRKYNLYDKNILLGIKDTLLNEIK